MKTVVRMGTGTAQRQRAPAAEFGLSPVQRAARGEASLASSGLDLHMSPRSAAQRRRLDAAFGPAVQRETAPDEEELQMKAQPGVAQRQGLEEEEPLQGRFETAQRQGAEEDELQMKPAPAAPAQLEAESPPPPNRTGLPDGLKTGIESLSGLSMDHVKVHHNSAQPAQLNALAYAQGSDIHLAPGQEQHLPHEAWHVVQQAQGRVQPTMQLKEGVPVNDDQGLEREADVMGAKAFVGKDALVNDNPGLEADAASGLPAPIADTGTHLKSDGVVQRVDDQEPLQHGSDASLDNPGLVRSERLGSNRLSPATLLEKLFRPNAKKVLDKLPQERKDFYSKRGLSHDELVGICLYTTNAAYAMNGVLRNQLRSQVWVENFGPPIVDCRGGLKKLKTYKVELEGEMVPMPLVYRNIDFTSYFKGAFKEQYKVGNTLTEVGFTSTTTVRDAYDPGLPVKWTVFGVKAPKSIRELSDVQGEDEVLLPPQQKFEIVQIHAADSNTGRERYTADPMKLYPRDDETETAFNAPNLTWHVNLMHKGGGGGEANWKELKAAKKREKREREKKDAVGEAAEKVEI